MWGFNVGMTSEEWNDTNDSIYYLNYLLMSVEQLAGERESLQAVVDYEIALAQMDTEQVRTDNESAMLKGQEAEESIRIYEALKKKYVTTVQELGGVEQVLKDLENYIVGKLGDENYRTSVDKRKYDKKDPLEVKQLKTALRAILDDSPSPPSHFGSFLHPAATGHIGPSWGSGAGNGREVLAYFWLAASDPDMALAAEDEPSREQCVRAEKMVVIAGLSDIRRGHNDGSYSPVDADFDDCSCAPGTWGRIAKMHVHNTLTQMQLASSTMSPAPKFKDHMEPFVIEKFKTKSLQQQLQMINALNNQFISGEKAYEDAPFATFEQFISDINQSRALRRAYIDEMANQYGKTSELMQGKYLDLNHLKLAHITFTEELVKMKQAPTLDLVTRLQNIAISNLFNPILNQVKAELGSMPEVKKARDALVRIAQSQKSTLKLLENINSKIQNLDRKANDFSSQLEALKKEKTVLSARFSVLVVNKENQEKVIIDVAKKNIVEKVKPIIQDNLVVSTKQVDKLIAQLLPQDIVKAAALQADQKTVKPEEVVDSVGVSPELNGITVEILKNHHAYKLFAQSFQAQRKSPEEVEKLTNARVLKAILQINNPDHDADKIISLIEEWQSANASISPKVAVSSPSNITTTKAPVDAVEQLIDKLSVVKQIEYAQRLAGVPTSNYPSRANEKLSDIENPKVIDFDKALKRLDNIINAMRECGQTSYVAQAERVKITIANHYYQLAVNVGAANMAIYNDAIAKAQACGLNCELGFDPQIVKRQGLDQAVINPSWLMGIKAHNEDIEGAFKLNSAAVSKKMSDLRYDNLIKSFSDFALKNASEVRDAEAALEAAFDNYFMEVDKNPPDQVLLLQKYQALQLSQQNMILQIDNQIAQFKQYYLADHVQYYETDSAYLRRVLMDTDLIEQKLDPALHVLYSAISDRMKQFSQITPLVTAHDRAISKVKRDCLDLIDDFSTKVSDKAQVLESRNPKKSSLAGKQLKAFKTAQTNLANLDRARLANDPAGNSINAFQNLGHDGVQIANRLEASLDHIGQASKFKRSIRSFRNGVRAVFRRIGLNVDQIVPKELSRAEIASIKLDAEKINPIVQNTAVESKKQKIKQHDNNRSKAVLSSFAKNYRKAEQDASLLTESEAILALRYIQSHIDEPFKINLSERFKEGVNVTFASDLHIDPISLRFENPMSGDEPKLIKMEAHVLKQFAKNQTDHENQQQLFMDGLERMAILFNAYESLGVVGTQEGRPERIEFVRNLNHLSLINRKDLLELVLMSQTTKGLQVLQTTLSANNEYQDLLSEVRAVSDKKEAAYALIVEDSRSRRRPLPLREEWERTIASESAEELRISMRSEFVANKM